MYVLIAVLLIIVAIFGVSSGMQSYATAQQAQAQIETAQAAQISAAGNLVTILAMCLGTVAVVAIIAAVIWYMLKRSSQQTTRSGLPTISRPRVTGDQPQIDINTLMQLKMLEILGSIGTKPAGQQNIQALPGSTDQDPEQDVFYWLSRK